jgi:hypothetical protein
VSTKLCYVYEYEHLIFLEAQCSINYRRRLSALSWMFEGVGGLEGSESIATLPSFGPIVGQKWFDQISSQ